MAKSMIKKALKKVNKKIKPGKLYFPPEWIVLGVNNVCNLHCKMCDVGTNNFETNFAQNLVGSHPLNMPIELFKKIADDVSKHFPHAKLGYAFTEPLVYPQLRESLLYAKDKKIDTYLTTNALNLKRKAEDLVDGGLKELFISLDGLEKTHNYIRGNKLSFQKAIEGIEYISTFNNAPEISIYFVITEWNYKEIFDFASYFEGLPVKHVGFMHQNFVTTELAATHNKLLNGFYPATHSNIEQVNLDAIVIEELYAEIKRVKDQNFRIKHSFSPELSSLEELEIFYRQPDKKIGKQCNDVFSNLMVKTDGTVIPSHGRCYNSAMGNVNENTLREIWNSKLYGNFRNELARHGGLFPACNRCCSAF